MTYTVKFWEEFCPPELYFNEFYVSHHLAYLYYMYVDTIVQYQLRHHDIVFVMGFFIISSGSILQLIHSL